MAGPEPGVGERGFDRFNDDRHAAANAVGAAVVGVLALSVLAWLTVEYVLPWLLPWLADNARPVLWLIAAVAVAVGLNLMRELTAAFQEGRVDRERGTVILRQVDRRASAQLRKFGREGTTR